MCALTDDDTVVLTLKGVDTVPLTENAIDNAPFVLHFVAEISDSNNMQFSQQKGVKCLYVPTTSKLLHSDRFILNFDEVRGRTMMRCSLYFVL